MKFLVVDWDEHELRFLLAAVQKGAVDVRKFGVLSVSNEGKKASVFASIENERIDKCPVLLVLNRSKVDIFYQTFPPSSDKELPVLLKNQAIRELPHYAEHDTLDYILLEKTVNDGTQESKVLAAAVPLVFQQSVVQSFRSIHRKVLKAGFRPLAVAELIFRSDAAPEETEPSLLLCLAGNEVEIIAMQGKTALFLRSFRLPEFQNEQDAAQRIADEIIRTLAVEPEGITQSIQKIFLFGNSGEWAAVAEKLTEKELETVVINPFELPNVHVVRNTADGEEMKNAGQFAPLLGMIFSAKPNTPVSAQMDFLHPKEPPKPKNYAPSILLAFLLLCIAGFSVYQWNKSVIDGLEKELTNVKKEHKTTAAALQAVSPNYQTLFQTQQWELQNVGWLDELKELSQMFPDQQDLVITKMSFTTDGVVNNRRVLGIIQLSGMVRDPSVLLKLRNDLQLNGHYFVRYPVPTVNPAGGGYPWLFQTIIYKLQ